MSDSPIVFTPTSLNQVHPNTDSKCASVFRQARYYRWGRRGYEALWLVFHEAECSETNGAAEGLMAYAASMSDGRQASWTYAVDRDSVTQSVRERDAAFHAPPLNDCSIGIEHAGFSRQTGADWSDDYSREMLERSAHLFADLCTRYDIPPVFRTELELVEALPLVNERAGYAQAKHEPPASKPGWPALRQKYGGIVTHLTVSRAFKKSTHTDPGSSFPQAAFAARVAELVALTTAVPMKSV